MGREMTGAHRFPPGFFDRADAGSDDRVLPAVPRIVTHIDDGAIAAVGALYDELGSRRLTCSTS